MRPTLPDFSAARVLVAGDLMLDRYWHGPTSRISPEAPVPVVRIEDIEDRPGGAGNVALNVASLAGRSMLLALTGDDHDADKLRQCLEPRQVDCRLVAVPGSRTVTKHRILSRHQQLIRLDFEDGFGGFDGAGLAAPFQDALDGADVVILSDYGKGTLRDAPALIAAARAAGKIVLVDPKGSDFSRYKNASVITPNLAEFEAVVGPCASEAELVAKGEALRRELHLDALLVTRSEQGMTLLVKDQPPLHLPTRTREVFDVTGAGDTVIAVLATALAAGEGWPAATALANIAAGVVVGKLGTATVSVEELQAAMLAHEPLQRGIVEPGELEPLLTRARANGERIVMTNGCFDILHAGHVAYLAQARALGDRLIVAVNDDASVARLKGAGRPVNPVMQRMAVLSGLESVDWVVPFSGDTPEALICALRPDLLVKGGDYRPDQIAGGKCVREAGGEVVVLDFIDGCSTTALIEAIRKQV